MQQPADLNPRVVTLGTAGGPRWWSSKTGQHRHGIATAVVVGDSYYLVDAGLGVGRQLERAELSFDGMRAIFVTHLHSDHTVDLPSLLTMGLYARDIETQGPIQILGPGDRGMLPPVSSRAEVEPQPVCPDNPTPGTYDMVHSIVQAYATDLNDRILDALRPSPLDCFTVCDIHVPADCGYHPNDNPTPAGMAPFEVYRDELVTVTAILVEHPPIAPAFAFRFDTVAGSVTISGDTTATDNIVTLATGTDLLLHEAIDFDWVETAYSGGKTDTEQASIDHHRVSHTSPEQAIELATRAGASRLALHHLVPGNTPNERWQALETTFDGEFHIPHDLDSISFARQDAPRQDKLAKVGV